MGISSALLPIRRLFRLVCSRFFTEHVRWQDGTIGRNHARGFIIHVGDDGDSQLDGGHVVVAKASYEPLDEYCVWPCLYSHHINDHAWRLAFLYLFRNNRGNTNHDYCLDRMALAKSNRYMISNPSKLFASKQA